MNLTVANGESCPTRGRWHPGRGHPTLRNVRLTGNTSFADFGGGLSVENGARATVSGSELDGNFTDGVGAAIFNDGPPHH